MKGLDGIQGPVYVGTGCVFKRQALYGYDPPAKSKGTKSGNSGLCPTWCCGPRKTGPKKAKSAKGVKKRAPTRSNSNVPIFSLEDIEEGIEGRICTCTIFLGKLELHITAYAVALFIT